MRVVEPRRDAGKYSKCPVCGKKGYYTCLSYPEALLMRCRSCKHVARVAR